MKEIVLSPDEIIEYVRNEVSVDDIFELSYNRVFAPGIVIGIQEEDEPDPIILSDGQIERLLTTAPFVEFKQTCSQLPPGQIKQIAQYAINNGVGSLDRCGYIKEITGIDIMKSIEVKRQIEEE